MGYALNKRDLIILLLTVASVLLVVLLETYSYYSPTQNPPSNETQLDETSNNNNVTSTTGETNGPVLVKQNRPNISQYMCGFSPDGDNNFIREFSLPSSCSQPVGLAVDRTNKIWVAATLTGHLAIFDPTLKSFTDLIKIPNWKSEDLFGSMVWAMEFDTTGYLWFADQNNNAIWKYSPYERKFEMYKIPTPGSYPSSIVIDSQGRIWFSEIFGKKIGLIDPALTEHNTSKGISEYPVQGIEFETLGPISISKNKDALWLTAVKYPEGGSILKFDFQEKRFTVFNLSKGSAVPIGIVEDNSGKLWINDHATNLFFSFDTVTKKIVKYSTSLPTSRNNTTTLPYWNLISNDNLWFNEHEGNAIAYFNIKNSTLVEFKIPTGSEEWGNTSNPLKFTVDNFGSVWFTEWTENKLGLLDNNKLKNLPLVLNVSENTVALSRATLDEKSIKVYVIPNQVELNDRVKMTAAGSMSPSGRLWNMTGEFNIKEFQLPILKDSKKLAPYPLDFKIKPTKDLLPGNYTLTIGARYADVTYSKIINVIVT